MRSETAPDTIVVAVPQNPNWKMKNAINQGPAVSPKKKPDVPNNPPAVTPNINPKPNTQKTTEERQKSAKFLAATLMLFLVRTKPLSRHEKPACMSMTRAAQMRIHAMSRVWPVVSMPQIPSRSLAERIP